MITRPVFLPELGTYFVELRDAHGWKQSRAADIARRRRIALSYNTLRWIEDGKIKNPEPEALRALATLYGVSYEEVVRKYVQERFRVQLAEVESGPQSTVEGFVTLPFLSTPIVSGQPLLVEPDPEHDSSLAFRKDAIKKFTRPVCLRVGRREESMTPMIRPGDVVMLDQNIERRRHPEDGQVYVVNLDALEDDEHGGGLQRIEVSGSTLILNADNADKSRYPTRAFDIKGKNLPDILVGEVVWFGRYMGSGKRR